MSIHTARKWKKNEKHTTQKKKKKIHKYSKIKKPHAIQLIKFVS